MSPEEARQKLAFEATPARSSDVDGFRERVPRRIALRLLPFLFLLYVVAFLDRMNVGAAALQMPQDLGFSDQVLGLGAGIFFLRGRRRGGFFSGGGGLPDALVPGRGPREGRGGFLRGDATLLRHWFTTRGPVAWIELARLERLEVAVHY